MVPLDRALPSCCWLSSKNSAVMIWPQFAILTVCLDPQSDPPNPPFCVGDRSPCLIQCYLGPSECPCQMASRSVQGPWQSARV